LAESENAFLPRFRQPHHVLHATTPNDPNLWRVRYDTVNQGRISLRWGNKMLHLGIRRDHNRAEVIALIHGLEATVMGLLHG